MLENYTNFFLVILSLEYLIRNDLIYTNLNEKYS
jgi:hypothetical protein